VSSIDLNADLGEGDPCDLELLGIVSSCNIACGGHAGDAETMRTTVLSALENDVSIGAHPSYPDREGFGRRSGYMSGEELLASLTAQIGELNSLVIKAGARLTHVKPHGALYNDAVNDRELADIIARAIGATVPDAAFVGLPESELQNSAVEHGLEFVAEGFIDRAYQENGQLVPRSEPGAVHNSLELVLPQAVSLVGKVDTLCIHGDTPGAADAAAAVRHELEMQGVEIRAIRR
jgi:UPF0271 protein